MYSVALIELSSDDEDVGSSNYCDTKIVFESYLADIASRKVKAESLNFARRLYQNSPSEFRNSREFYEFLTKLKALSDDENAVKAATVLCRCICSENIPKDLSKLRGHQKRADEAITVKTEANVEDCLQHPKANASVTWSPKPLEPTAVSVAESHSIKVNTPTLTEREEECQIVAVVQAPAKAPNKQKKDGNGSQQKGTTDLHVTPEGQKGQRRKQKKNQEMLRKKKVYRLRKLLEAYQKEIQTLSTAELSLEEMDQASSSYVKESKLKERCCVIMEKLNELEDGDYDFGESRKRIRVSGSQFMEINRAVEDFVNEKRRFPDVFDIRNVVRNVNESFDLGLRPNEEHQVAIDVFSEVGNRLQKKRKRDFRKYTEYYYDEFGDQEDPALFDNELRRKLKMNKKISRANTNKVFKTFAQIQLEQSQGHSSSDEECMQRCLDHASVITPKVKRKRHVHQGKKGEPSKKRRVTFVNAEPTVGQDREQSFIAFPEIRDQSAVRDKLSEKPYSSLPSGLVSTQGNLPTQSVCKNDNPCISTSNPGSTIVSCQQNVSVTSEKSVLSITKNSPSLENLIKHLKLARVPVPRMPIPVTVSQSSTAEVSKIETSQVPVASSALITSETSSIRSIVPSTPGISRTEQIDLTMLCSSSNVKNLNSLSLTSNTNINTTTCSGKSRVYEVSVSTERGSQKYVSTPVLTAVTSTYINPFAVSSGCVSSNGRVVASSASGVMINSSTDSCKSVINTAAPLKFVAIPIFSSTSDTSVKNVVVGSPAVRKNMLSSSQKVTIVTNAQTPVTKVNAPSVVTSATHGSIVGVNPAISKQPLAKGVNNMSRNLPAALVSSVQSGFSTVMKNVVPKNINMQGAYNRSQLGQIGGGRISSNSSTVQKGNVSTSCSIKEIPNCVLVNTGPFSQKGTSYTPAVVPSMGVVPSSFQFVPQSPSVIGVHMHPASNSVPVVPKSTYSNTNITSKPVSAIRTEMTIQTCRTVASRPLPTALAICLSGSSSTTLTSTQLPLPVIKSVSSLAVAKNSPAFSKNHVTTTPKRGDKTGPSRHQNGVNIRSAFPAKDVKSPRSPVVCNGISKTTKVSRGPVSPRIASVASLKANQVLKSDSNVTGGMAWTPIASVLNAASGTKQPSSAAEPKIQAVWSKPLLNGMYGYQPKTNDVLVRKRGSQGELVTNTAAKRQQNISSGYQKTATASVMGKIRTDGSPTIPNSNGRVVRPTTSINCNSNYSWKKASTTTTNHSISRCISQAQQYVSLSTHKVNNDSKMYKSNFSPKKVPQHRKSKKTEDPEVILIDSD